MTRTRSQFLQKGQFPIKGFSTLEGVLSVALIAIVAIPLGAAAIASSEAAARATLRAQALNRAEEGVEAVRNITEHNFSNLSAGTWGLALQNNVWALVGNSDTSDDITRTIRISVIDKSTKQIESSVSWQQMPQQYASTTIATIVTDWMAGKGKEK